MNKVPIFSYFLCKIPNFFLFSGITNSYFPIFWPFLLLDALMLFSLGVNFLDATWSTWPCSRYIWRSVRRSWDYCKPWWTNCVLRTRWIFLENTFTREIYHKIHCPRVQYKEKGGFITLVVTSEQLYDEKLNLCKRASIFSTGDWNSQLQRCRWSSISLEKASLYFWAFCYFCDTFNRYVISWIRFCHFQLREPVTPRGTRREKYNCLTLLPPDVQQELTRLTDVPLYVFSCCVFDVNVHDCHNMLLLL